MFIRTFLYFAAGVNAVLAAYAFANGRWLAFGVAVACIYLLLATAKARK